MSKTSRSGTTSRINHNSDLFYNSRLYKGFKSQKKKDKEKENTLKNGEVNKLYCTSSEAMSELLNGCIHLVVTSPPYNVGKIYDKDFTLDEYLKMLKRVFSECYRVLISGGRACINVANIGRKPYIPLHAYLVLIMQEIGFLMRGEIIWHKGAGAGVSCAWGSWKSASNPCLRDVHEYILVFSKVDFRRQCKQNTIKKEEFLEFTKSVWEFSPVSAKKVGHPAPFPEELPRRLIQLYSFEKDIILDPFCGSGTTCIAALKANRQFIGYEIDKGYIELAKSRIDSLV